VSYRLAAALAVLAFLPLEVRAAARFTDAGAAPDLLLAAAIALALHPAGGPLPAALLGTLRDALSGGPAGARAAAFLAAAVAVRALSGAALGRPRGLLLTTGLVLAGALLAGALAALADAFAARLDPWPFLAHAARAALLTAACSPLATVPLGAIEAALGPAARIDLSKPLPPVA